MLTHSASEAKQNFAAMLDAAAREPVADPSARSGRRDRLISPEQYRKLHRAQCRAS